MAKVLTEKDRLRLNQLLLSDGENKQLALTIIDRCDIEKSFAHILIMIKGPGGLNPIRVMSSEILGLPNVFEYVALVAGTDVFPKQPDINIIMTIWDGHAKHCKLNIRERAKMKKYILKAVNNLPSKSLSTFDIKLNPKKNVRKKS